jgi:hypothetical protein
LADDFRSRTIAGGDVVTGTSVDYLGAPWDVSDGSHAIDLDGRDATFSGIMAVRVQRQADLRMAKSP